MSENFPLVSIGLPVHNGADLLPRAVRSLVAQDYPNLEILIVDNGSEDDTEKIARDFADSNPRVKYFRSDENRGSYWSFNKSFELASGEYFLWAAHDDIRDKRYVGACVAALEANPNAVLCHSHTGIYVQGDDRLMCVATLASFQDKNRPVARYREALRHFPAVAIYGVYRSSAMRKTQLFERHIATDLAFVQELLIQGEIEQVPDILFEYHARARWTTIHEDYSNIYGRGRKPWWYSPFLVLFTRHVKRVLRAPVTVPTRGALLLTLVAHHIGLATRKLAILLVQYICPAKHKKRFGRLIYWRYLHSPNLEVTTPDLFEGRVLWPRLRWR